MKRILVLGAGIIMQICLGTIYAWSFFGLQLRETYGLGSAHTEFIYGLGIGVFAFGTIITGRLVYRIGPRSMSLISAVLFALAFGGASLTGSSYPGLLITLGPVLGLAIAFGYVCPLSTAVGWFPHHKGMVTGLAVMGFGGGAFLSTSLSKALASNGYTISDIFRFIAIIGSLTIGFAALFLQRAPQENHSNSSKTSDPVPRILSHQKPFYRTTIFWALAGAMFLATIGGLIVIGVALNMANDYQLHTYSALTIGLLTLGNAGGRLLWGIIMDKLASRTLLVSFAVMICGFICLALGENQPLLFLTGIFVTGLQFGASLVIFATYTERYYGPGAIGRVYPWIFACYGVAALTGPWAGGIAHDLSGSYQQLMWTLSVLPLVAIALVRWGLRSTKIHRSRVS